MSEPSVVDVYRRILKAAAKGNGIRLSYAECVAFRRDQAVEQAIATDDGINAEIGGSYGS